MGVGTGSIDLSTLNNLRNDLTQYFWFNSNTGATYGTGVHITLSPQSSFMTNPVGQNILMNTDGISIRNGLIPLMVLDNDSLDFNVVDDLTQGTYSNAATFGEYTRIGMNKAPHIRINSNSIIAEDGEDNEMYSVRYFEVGSTGSSTTMYMTESWTVSEQATGGTFELTYYPTQIRVVSLNGYAASYQQSTDNPKQIFISETLQSGDEVEIQYTTYGANSYFTFGQRQPNSVIGNTSFASGNNVEASGAYSHAEGYRTNASGAYSHAEGKNTVAWNVCHAEGNGCVANRLHIHAGIYLPGHAEGYETIATGNTVIGYRNVDDSSYRFIIGNGALNSTVRSNAFAVDSYGNVKAQGSFYANCASDSSGTAYIGQVFDWQGNLKSNLTANAGSYVEGNGSITLRGGHVYLVLAYVAMTNSTNGTVDRRAQIFNKKANSSVLTGAKFVASQSWGTVETQTIYEAREDVTLTVRGSASRPTTTIPTAWIRAVCIA